MEFEEGSEFLNVYNNSDKPAKRQGCLSLSGRKQTDIVTAFPTIPRFKP